MSATATFEPEDLVTVVPSVLYKDSLYVAEDQAANQPRFHLRIDGRVPCDISLDDLELRLTAQDSTGRVEVVGSRVAVDGAIVCELVLEIDADKAVSSGGLFVGISDCPGVGVQIQVLE